MTPNASTPMSDSSARRPVPMSSSTSASPQVKASLLEGLTEREQAVLAQVGRGRTNDEVARELFISPATARAYVSRLLTKLGARDRSPLVVLACESGLVKPGAAD